MSDTRWETRLLVVLAAILVVFGLAAVYGASSLVMISGGQVGSGFALRQALGAAVGGIVATILARTDYRKWQRAAWPVLALAAVLLVIPLLFIHFRRSERGTCVFIGYLIACLFVMLLSWIFFLFPGTRFLFTQDLAVPVKNAATQSGEFVTCIFGLLYLAIDAFAKRHWVWVAALDLEVGSSSLRGSGSPRCW